MATPGWSRRRETVGGFAVPARSAPAGLDSYHFETMLVTNTRIRLGSNASTKFRSNSASAFNLSIVPGGFTHEQISCHCRSRPDVACAAAGAGAFQRFAQRRLGIPGADLCRPRTRVLRAAAAGLRSEE